MLNEAQVYARISTSPYFPTLPDNISHILELLSQEEQNIDTAELSAAIEQDGELAGIIIKNLNARGFALRGRVNTIQDAIVYLGINSARNLIVFFITHKFYPPARKPYTQLFTIYRYWAHVLSTAIAAEDIATRLGQEDPFSLFTYGLLHDVGILAIDACLPREEEQILAKMRTGTHQLQAEREVLDGLTHADVGAWLFKREKFPPEMACAAKYHHHDGALDSPCLQISRTLYVANVLGTEFIAGALPFDIHEELDMGVVEELGLTAEDIEQVRGALPGRVAKFEAQPIGID